MDVVKLQALRDRVLRDGVFGMAEGVELVEALLDKGEGLGAILPGPVSPEPPVPPPGGGSGFVAVSDAVAGQGGVGQAGTTAGGGAGA